MAEVDGYFGEGFFGEGYWGEGYFGDIAFVVGGGSARYYYYKAGERPENRKEFLQTVKRLLESIRG